VCQRYRQRARERESETERDRQREREREERESTLIFNSYVLSVPLELMLQLTLHLDLGNVPWYMHLGQQISLILLIIGPAKEVLHC
jgi:hypothetical protein